MDFIINLPLCGSFNGIFTYMDKLTKWVKLIPVFLDGGQLIVCSVTHLFLEHVVYNIGVPTMILHNHGPQFTSWFLTTLW